MRVIAIINQKGGCGKTTSAINLGAIFARRGLRTLIIDMDPQSHCAAGLGIPESRIELDIGDALLSSGARPLDLSRVLWPAGRNLDLAPSRMRLAGLEARAGGLADKPDKEQRLAAVIARLKGRYDVVCIDCPPAIGLLTFNALAAATTVLIPVETSFFALQGATRQVNTVRTLARRMGKPVPVWLLPTIHDESSPVSRDLLLEMNRRFGARVVPHVIRRDPRLRESASFGQPIIDFAPDSAGANDYAEVANWLLQNGLVAHEDDGPEEAASALAAEREPPSVEVVAGVEPPPPTAGPSAVLERIGPTRGAVTERKPLSRAEEIARRSRELQGFVGEPAQGVLVLEKPQAEEAPDSIRTLFGVRQTPQGVLFVQPLSLGVTVAIAGDFNGWSDRTHVMRPSFELGVHQLVVKLPPGRHQYRLVIDGHWTADPHNPVCQPNPFGETNSVAEVAPAVLS